MKLLRALSPLVTRLVRPRGAMRCIVVLFLLLSGTVRAEVFEAPDRVWAQLFLGLSFYPGPGDWLSIDGPPWSVDPSVSYVSTSQGRALSVTFGEDCEGCDASGVGVFPDPELEWIPGEDIPDYMAFVVLTGPPRPPGQVLELLHPQAVPEPATPMVLAVGLALLLGLSRAARSPARPAAD